jgi:hypothetical protein
MSEISNLAGVPAAGDVASAAVASGAELEGLDCERTDPASAANRTTAAIFHILKATSF